MNGKVLRWLATTYTKNGRFTGAMLEDLVLLASMAAGFWNLLSPARNPNDGFFDSTLTVATLVIAVLVMVVYHLLWRNLDKAMLQQERLIEQIPRFLAALCLLIGLYNFSKNLPLFIVSLVLFYSFLVLWQWLISSDLRKARGTFVFDCFGLLCAAAFSLLAIELYLNSGLFWQTLPNYANDPLSADVVKRSFAGKQTNRVYMMGLFAGAMAANAILAFSTSLYRSADGKYKA